MIALALGYFILMLPFRLFTDVHESRHSTLQGEGVKRVARGEGGGQREEEEEEEEEGFC